MKHEVSRCFLDIQSTLSIVSPSFTWRNVTVFTVTGLHDTIIVILPTDIKSKSLQMLSKCTLTSNYKLLFLYSLLTLSC